MNVLKERLQDDLAGWRERIGQLHIEWPVGEGGGPILRLPPLSAPYSSDLRYNLLTIGGPSSGREDGQGQANAQNNGKNDEKLYFKK